MIGIEELFNRLAKMQISLWIENGTLCYSAPKGTMTKSLMLELEEKKNDIISYLSQKKVAQEDKQVILSSAQERLWFFGRLVEDTSFYNICGGLEFNGNVDMEALQDSIQYMVNRHAILRTNFGINEPVQIVHPVGSCDLDFEDLSGCQEDEKEKRLIEIIKEQQEINMNLAEGKLLYATMVRLNSLKHVLAFAIHHIIADNWSLRLFVSELLQCYQSFAVGQKPSLSELKYQYMDYCKWQRQNDTEEVLNKKLDFWKEYLKGMPPMIELPTDKGRPAVQDFKGDSYTTFISKDLLDRLNIFSREHHTTLFCTMMAAYQVLMHRYSGQDDLAVGMPLANRNRKEVESMIGFFVNVHAVRSNIEDDPTFIQVLEKTKHDIMRIQDYQDVPLESIVETLGIERDLSKNPLYQVVFQMQRMEENEAVLHKVSVKPYKINMNKVRFDIEVYGYESNDNIQLDVVYSTSLFKKSTIEQMMKHYQNLLESILKAPNEKVHSMELMGKEEKNHVLAMCTGKRIDYSTDKAEYQLFEKMVEEYPNSIAVVMNQQQLTYCQLNKRANQLARILVEKGATDNNVGVYMARSVEMIVGILATLKAGAAYIPLDPMYPPQRIITIIQDAPAKILLTTEKLSENIQDFQGEILRFEQLEQDIDRQEKTNLNLRCDRSKTSYIIYTSGSTGKPKGVLVSHRALLNLINWHQDAFGITDKDHASQLAGVSFDACVWEIWPYLTKGAALYLVDAADIASPEDLKAWFVTKQITVSFVPTPLAEQMLSLPWEERTSLRYMLTGGDRLHCYVKKGLPFQLINNYGPTENTVVSTSGPVPEKGDTIFPVIGKPIHNVTVYVLDSFKNLVPVGIKGQLYISGKSLSNGYLNREDLNKEKFIQDSFLKDGSLMYSSGDCVRILSDGNIEFIDRIDSQVKIRGFRIELGEIESTIAGFENIDHAKVIVKEKNNDNRIIAYYSTLDGNAVSIVKLRTYLKTKLPHYMVPAGYVKLERFPLTPNGKVDVRQLSEPKEEHSNTVTAQQVDSETQKIIEKIWIEVLQTDHIDLDDNFFDIGGHSLLITKVHKMLRDVIQKNVSVMDLFQYPTIRFLSEYIDGTDEASRQRKDESNVSVKRKNGQRDQEIAVIGMAGHFPGAKNTDEFWKNLKHGVESIRKFSYEELKEAGIDEKTLNHPNYIRARGWLEDIDKFDADFFGFSKREAQILDPQHRIFMETAWEALESAGYVPENYKGKISVFAGTGFSLYFIQNILQNANIIKTVGGYHALICNDKDFLPSRLAYKLNLKGPAVNVNTACSTSLVSIHMACKSLINYESDMALAGGVSVGLPEKQGYFCQEGGINSRDGHCRAFDKDASGTVSGSGAGAVILKRLEDAKRDGDTIYAIVKGSAINNDGSVKVGFTAPGIDGQTECIRAAYHDAEVAPETVGYIETHGTGTVLGDPIEIKALQNVFHGSQDRKVQCAIGSLKTNIGHLDAAAGVAGFIKTVLCLHHKTLVPSLFFKEPNPEINLEKTSFYVNTQCKEWALKEGKRRAGISAFGIGGTNAHIVLEEGEESLSEVPERRKNILLASARTEQGAVKLKETLVLALGERSEVDRADAMYTTQIGRKNFRYRICLICNVSDRLIEHELPIKPADTNLDDFCLSYVPYHKVNYDFIKELYKKEPLYRVQVDACISRLGENFDLEEIKRAIKEELYNITLGNENTTILFGFIVEYAMSSLFKQFINLPKKVIGRGKSICDCLEEKITIQEAANQFMAESSNTELSNDQDEMDGTHMILIGQQCIEIESDENFEPDEWLVSSLGQLWQRGYLVNWKALYGNEHRSRKNIPTYPFEKNSYWIVPDKCEEPQENIIEIETHVSVDRIEEQLVHIWESILGVEIDNNQVDFFELGGDSLMIINLLESVKETFDINIDLKSMFYNDTTLSGMLKMLKKELSATKAEVTNEEQLIQQDINEELGIVLNEVKPYEQKIPENIFLTGATGFVGGFLLSVLLKQTNAAIYCLVRAENKKQAEEKVIGNLKKYSLWNAEYSKRLVYILGDLAEPRLGMEKKVFEQLSKDIEVIYHCGAYVNHLHAYTVLRKVNVNGTKEVINLAAKYKVKPIHYVSTLAVFGNGEGLNGKILQENMELPDSKVLNFGYARSKWAAEKILDKARISGIPVSIYRAGNVTGDARTGITNFGDTIWRLIVGNLQMGIGPRMDKEATFNITPVDFVSKAIVYISLQAESLNSNYHIYNTNEMTMTECMEGVGKVIRKDMELLPFEEWRSRAVENLKNNKDNVLYPLLPLIENIGLPNNELVTDTQNAQRYLCKASIDCRNVDKELIATYFKYFWKEGYLEII